MCLQLSVKERLTRVKADEQMKVESKPDATNMKTKALSKALRGCQVAACLRTWPTAQRKAMEDDGMSRQELLDQLAPVVGAKAFDDPGKTAADDFVKLHKKMEA